MKECEFMAKSLSYENYPLTRVITIYDIVSADYVHETYTPCFSHRHDGAWELCYCLQGELLLFKNNQPLSLCSGEITFISPGTTHDSQITHDSTRAFLISFTCSDSYIKVLSNSILPVTSRQERLFQLVLDELELAFEPEDQKRRRVHFSPNQNSPVGSEQLICNYLEQIIIDILREITKQNGKPIPDKNFTKAVNQFLADNVSAYIRSHIREPLTVEKIAGEFHYSRSRLSTIYKATTGTGINEFLSEERMAQARQLLLEGQLTVTQISELLGYSSPQYFSRKFAKSVGCPPSLFARTSAPVKQENT